MRATIRATSSVAPALASYVRAPQFGRQQVIAAEHVERQVTVAIIISVEEAPLLASVDRIVGCVQVERDAGWRLGMSVLEQIDEGVLDGVGIVGDLMVAIVAGRCVLQPVQRALAGERGAGGPACFQPPQHRAEHRVVAQIVVVDHILVPERDTEDPLADQGRHVVHHPLCRPTVDEAGGKALDQIDRLVRRAQKQGPGIRTDRTAAEIRNHIAPIKACKQHRFRVTLCRHRGLH